MDLGRFSVSLAVKDMEASLAFYSALGFEIVDGGHLHEGFADTDTTKWRILSSGAATIGLFQGMFQDNIMTFNPDDARAIQRDLQAKGIAILREADDEGTGPAHFVLQDPDGNTIMFDQN